LKLTLRLIIIAALALCLIALFFFYGRGSAEEYQGELLNGEPHGFGVWKHQSGVTYVGEFINGQWNGRGTWIHPDGIKYAGDWISGEYHGRGTLILPGGGRYDGEWANGKKQGPGIYRWPDGKIYSGWWKEDRHEGFGILEHPDGFSYRGEWLAGYRSGDGSASYPDGTEYYGQWLNDKRHGQGTLLYPDGSIYEGSWYEDLKQGEGTLTYPDGTSTTAIWVKGQLQEIAVTSVTLEPSSITLAAGGAPVTLDVEILPADATNQQVTWASSNTKVATVSDGVVRPLQAGSTTVTATTLDGRLTSFCTVSVSNNALAVNGVSLDRTSIRIRVGETATLVAAVKPSAATNPSVTWSSSNTAIAAVYQESGRRGQIRAFATGEVFITVTTSDGGYSARCQVTVLPKEDPANKVIVPRLIGKMLSQAQDLIIEAGLAIGDTRSEHHPTAPVDQVISQRPAVGSSVNKGSLVDVVISRGPEPAPEPEPDPEPAPDPEPDPAPPEGDGNDE
jgi:hypothetical protein